MLKQKIINLFDSLLDGEHIKAQQEGAYLLIYMRYLIYIFEREMKMSRRLEFSSSGATEKVPNNSRWDLLLNSVITKDMAASFNKYKRIYHQFELKSINNFMKYQQKFRQYLRRVIHINESN